MALLEYPLLTTLLLLTAQATPSEEGSVACAAALTDVCGSDTTWQSPVACAGCTAANRSALAAHGCAAAQLSSFCDGGACKTAIRTWCGQMKNPSFTTVNCLGCAGPAAYAGVITEGGCNGSFALWKDAGQHVPSPILSQACAERQCTVRLDLCVSPTVYWNGASGNMEVNETQRDACHTCVAAQADELQTYGCGVADIAEYCKGSPKSVHKRPAVAVRQGVILRDCL